MARWWLQPGCVPRIAACPLSRDGPPAGPVPDGVGRVPAQRQELVAALRQLDALERTVADSAARAPIQPGERYHFDYPRLLADLARVRAGIQAHLTPSRAQPRDPPNWPATTAPSGPLRHRRRLRKPSHERRPGLGISPTAASRLRRWRPSWSAPCSRCSSSGASGPSERPTWVVREPPQPAPVPRRLHPLRRDVPRPELLPPLLT